MNNYFNTYAFHDAKGRRLAVFCRFLDPETCKAEIFTLACSKKDQFSRKKAREVYDVYLSFMEGHEVTEAPANKSSLVIGGQRYTPTIVHVDITPESRQLQTLMRYCEDNYYWQISIPIEKEETMLIKVSIISPLIHGDA